MKNQFLLLLGACLLLACKHPANEKWGFWFENKSDRPVLMYASFVDDGKDLRPSTQWLDEDTYIISCRLVEIQSNTSRGYNLSAQDVRSYNSDSIAIFVLDPDTVAKYSWDQIGRERNYLKKIPLLVGDLHWGVVYP